MNQISRSRTEQILDNARGKKIAVLGDYMLDRHLIGAVRRISPEAPVPVVEIESETAGLGGAGNVIQNIATLGAVPLALGVIGQDSAGEALVNELRNKGALTNGMITSSSRKTTEKMRIIAHNQHVVRADRETIAPLSREDEDRILDTLESVIKELDALILEDYNKGVLTPRVIQGAISIAEKYDVPVAVDPKFDNFFLYSGVHLFKPNVKELEQALGAKLNDEAKVLEAGRKLFDKITPKHLLVTRGEKGMTLFHDKNRLQHIPTKALEVHDVSGAGDTVIATFMVAESGGATPSEAAILANYAAGVVCGEVGVVPIDRQRLLEVVEGRF